MTQQVNSIKARPNLLRWFTGDEPEGTPDPLDATVDSYNLINSLDGYPRVTGVELPELLFIVRIGHTFQHLLSIELMNNTETTCLEPTS